MSVAIVDYGSGNLHSAAKAFERAARESGHDQPIVVTSDPAQVARADRVVLPGVGAFADCRRGLDEIPGMIDALNESVAQAGQAVFRHLCRHAADGRARARISGDAGPGLDRRRGRPHHAGRSGSENSAHGLEHAQHAARPTRCSRTFRSGRMACMPISCTPSSSSRRSAAIWWRRPTTAARSRPSSGATTWSARNSIPEKSQQLGLEADREFFEVDSHDPVSRHRPQGRPRRAAGAGRHGARDHVPPRSGGAGARFRDARLQASARGRSRRRLCRQADERRRGRPHSRNRRACACSSAAASATWRRSRAGWRRASTASSSAPRRCAIRRW